MPKIKEVDVVEVAHYTIENLSTIHGDRFRLNFPDRLKVFVSPDGITRIIENLCTNAVKYGSTYDPVSVTIEANEQTFSICVKNKGNPLINVDKSKLFEPFERGEATQLSGKSGWGIGLTIVKGVAEAHRGEVSLESNDEGTAFLIRLPLDARPQPQSEPLRN